MIIRAHGVLKNTFMLMACLSVLLAPLGALGANDQDSAGGSLLQVTGDVKKYAHSVVKPRLGGIPSKDRLSKFLEIINVLLDPQDGIASSGLSVPHFMGIAQASGRQLLDPDSELLDGLPAGKRETVRILHNKYMLNHVAGIFFGPSAGDIIKHRSAFGCSHYARAFIAVVKALNLIDEPAELRYVVSSKSDDYNKCVELKGQGCPIINGHQFVLAKIENRWFALNTNKKNDYVAFPQGFTPRINLKKTNIPIVFNKIPGVVFVLRKIGRDYYDDCGDSSLAALMNISRSGDANSPELAWDKFYLQSNMAIKPE